MPLRPELRGEAFLAGSLREPPHLLHLVGEWLLEINMLAAFHRPPSGMEVRVVGGADHDRIDLLLESVEHRAEVGELGRPGVLLVGLAGPHVVNVAKRHDVLATHAFEIRHALAAKADDGNVEFVRGSLCGLRPVAVCGKESRAGGRSRRDGGSADGKRAARDRGYRLPSVLGHSFISIITRPHHRAEQSHQYRLIEAKRQSMYVQRLRRVSRADSPPSPRPNPFKNLDLATTIEPVSSIDSRS